MWHRKAAAAAIFLLLATAGTVRSQYLGVDRGGDMQCDPAEMVFAPNGGAGARDSFDVYFRDVPNPLGGVACTFCVHDSTGAALDSFVYHSPDGWADVPLVVNPMAVSPWIHGANRKAKCWLAQSNDLTFTLPWESPSPIGTAYFTVAADEPIHIILDPYWSAYFTVAYSTGRFCPSEGAGSDSCCCLSAAPADYDWDRGRTLLR